jgi:1-acyl-sn-glycerol-3-phosphate acyltransferase
MTGDHINPLDGALLLMNHRNRLDWNFLWGGIFYGAKPQAHKLKMVLKSALRHIPFAGWVMQLSGFLYIQRRWDHDQSSMEKQLKYFSDVKDVNQVKITVYVTTILNKSKNVLVGIITMFLFSSTLVNLN